MRKKFFSVLAFSALIVVALASIASAQNPYGNPYGGDPNTVGYQYPPQQGYPQTQPYYPQQYPPQGYIDPRYPLIPQVYNVTNLVPALWQASQPRYNNGYQQPYTQPYYPQPQYPQPYQQPPTYWGGGNAPGTIPNNGMGSVPGGTFYCPQGSNCFNNINQNGTGNQVNMPGGGFVGNNINQNGTGNSVNGGGGGLQYGNPYGGAMGGVCNQSHPCAGQAPAPQPYPIRIGRCNYGPC